MPIVWATGVDDRVSGLRFPAPFCTGAVQNRSRNRPSWRAQMSGVRVTRDRRAFQLRIPPPADALACWPVAVGAGALPWPTAWLAGRSPSWPRGVADGQRGLSPAAPDWPAPVISARRPGEVELEGHGSAPTSRTTLPIALPSATWRRAAAVWSSAKVAPMWGRTRPLASSSISSASLRAQLVGPVGGEVEELEAEDLACP